MKQIKKIKYRGMSVWAVISKDIKTIFRTKSSAFAIVLGPLFVMLLVGMAFNNSSLFGINVGTYSDGYSILSDEILTQLQNTEYSVDRANNTLECIRGVKNGEYNVCAVFPANLTISNNATGSITFYVDQSRINIVNTIMADINSQLIERAENISLDLAETITGQLFSTKDAIESSLGFVDGIKANQDILHESSRNIKNKATKIDLSVGYEMFEVEELKSAFADLKAKLNLSEPDANSVEKRINHVDSQVRFTIIQMTRAHNDVQEIASTLDTFPSLIDEERRNIDQIDENLKATSEDIDSIIITNPETIVRPFNTEIKQVAAQKTHIGRFLPTFIVLIIMFVSVLLSSGLILGEKTSSAYFRNTISTTPPYIFLVGAFLTSFLIVMVQLIVISLGLNFIVNFEMNLLSSIIIPVLLAVSMFILLGVTIGYFTNSQETANVIGLFLIIAAVFFSNTILPIEALPDYLKQIVEYNPFVVAEIALKKMMVFAFVLDKVKNHIWTLVFYNILFLILSYAGLMRSKKLVRER